MEDINRIKYLQLMVRIEDLEDKIAALKKKHENESSSPELKKLKEEYAKQRNELARISNGCGGHIV